MVEKELIDVLNKDRVVLKLKGDIENETNGKEETDLKCALKNSSRTFYYKRLNNKRKSHLHT